MNDLELTDFSTTAAITAAATTAAATTAADSNDPTHTANTATTVAVSASNAPSAPDPPDVPSELPAAQLRRLLFGPSPSDVVDLECLRTHVARHGLPDDAPRDRLEQPIRPLTWKLLLGVISSARPDWLGQEQCAREAQYLHRLRWVTGAKPVRHTQSDEQGHGDAQDTVDDSEENDHPLCDRPQSRWRREFEAKTALELIDKDVARTMIHYGNRIARVSDSLRNILLLYSIDHSKFGYRQGMNELAATILLAMDPAPSSASPPPPSLEASAFFAFLEVMVEMAPLFSPLNPAAMDAQLALLSNALLRIDKPLFLKLRALEIDLRFFATKWLKLWFAHSYALPDLFRLWDAVLSSEVRMPWLRVLVLATLLLKRDKLLVCDDLPRAMNILLHETVPVDHILCEGGKIWPGSEYENR